LQPTPQALFPRNILDATIRERRLAGPIPVQVMDIEDIGKSRWSQVEAIEAEERGETTREREIIRVLPNEDGEADQPRTQTQAATPPSQSHGPHKLLLQDASGLQAYALETSPVSSISLTMSIGCKLLLRDIVVARGLVLLEPRSVTVVGGKIEELQNSWRARRKESLKAAANANANADINGQ
jgi:RecQ-mediated genome instability protein 1